MKKFVLALTAVATLASFSAQAGDAKAGKETATGRCVACHGNNGISTAPMWPNLAGQKEQYLIIQLENFKKGERKNTMMEPIAQALEQKDIENVAAFFSSLKP